MGQGRSRLRGARRVSDPCGESSSRFWLFSRLVEQSIDPVGNSSEEFGRYIQPEIGKWANIVRIAGITPE